MTVPAQLSLAVQSAHTLAAQGDNSGARDVIDQALDVATMVLGEGHPEVLTAVRALARLHSNVGELLEARRLLEEALLSGQRKLGDAHPVILDISYDLAKIAGDLGNLHEARKNYGRIATHGPAVLGPDHDYVVAASRYLGGASPQQGAPAQQQTPQQQAPPPQQQPTQPPQQPQPEQQVVDLFAQRVYRPDAAPEWPAPPVSSAPPMSSAPPVQHFPPSQSAPPGQPASRFDSFPDDDPLGGHAPIRFTGSGEPRRGRGTVVAIAVVAALVLSGGGFAITAALQGGGPDPGQTPVAKASHQSAQQSTQAPQNASKAPSSGGGSGAPTGLTLQDNGTSIKVTWQDPAGGQVTFLVAGGKGTDLSTLDTTHDTTYTLNGVNTRFDYCFTVAAVYSADRVVLSQLACTHRASSAPSRSR